MMNVYDEQYFLMLENLKAICHQRNLTGYALAKSTHISESSINDLMNGKTKPYVYTLLIICNTLNVSIGELFQSADSECNAYEAKLVSSYRCMSQEKRNMLKIYMDMLLQYDGI